LRKRGGFCSCVFNILFNSRSSIIFFLLVADGGECDDGRVEGVKEADIRSSENRKKTKSTPEGADVRRGSF
jgi:hypothetical protein